MGFRTVQIVRDSQLPACGKILGPSDPFEIHPISSIERLFRRPLIAGLACTKASLHALDSFYGQRGRDEELRLSTFPQAARLQVVIALAAADGTLSTCLHFPFPMRSRHSPQMLFLPVPL